MTLLVAFKTVFLQRRSTGRPRSVLRNCSAQTGSALKGLRIATKCRFMKSSWTERLLSTVQIEFSTGDVEKPDRLPL